MFIVPEKFRMKHGDFSTNEIDGNNGIFLIPYHENMILQCVASDGKGWEHVSVCVRFKNRNNHEIPIWNQMCLIKDTFWGEEDTVIQYHPARSEYVNNHPYVLHLWRPINKEIPIPSSILVGIK